MKIQDEIQAGRLGLVWYGLISLRQKTKPTLLKKGKKNIEGWKNNVIYKRGVLMLIDIEIKRSAIPRHSEIKNILAKNICKDIGINLIK